MENLQDSQYTPEVFMVQVSPEKPKAGEVIRVRAEIHNDRNRTSRETVETWVAYRVGEKGPLQRVDMKRATEDWFEATLGPFEAGDVVQWGIGASDTGENTYLESPCPVSTAWPPFDDPCLQASAVDQEPDDSEAVIGAEMDIREAFFGENDQEVFFEMRAEGAITEGTVNPPSINARVLGVLNMDKARNDLMKGFLPVYAPLARLVQREACMTIYDKGGITVDTSFIRCAVKEKRLMFGMKKSFLGENPSKLIKFALATGVLINLDPIDGLPKDVSQVTAVYRVARQLVVE